MITTIRARWKTRRMMALVAFWDLILTFPLSALLYKLKWIDAAYIAAMSGLLIAVITGITAIISTYIGAATYDDIKNKGDGS